METIIQKDSLRTKLKNSHLTGQHCQRNYDLEQTMPEADVELLIHAATQAPSKQNLDFFSVYAIQDRSTIERIYQVTKTEKGRLNPQVLGQLLLVFVKNPDVVTVNERNGESRERNEESLRFLNEDMHQAIGVAAGFSNLTASMLGYRCGCNKCFDIKAVKEILNLQDGEDPILMMGIGIKDATRNRRVEHNTGKMIDTFKKIPLKVVRV